MKVELHSNGTLQIHLTAQTPVEDAYLKTMRDAAEKGTAVRLTQAPFGGLADSPISVVVSMEV